MSNDLPRMLRDLEPAPGVIKADYEDFVVEEIPLYPADGSGTHTYFLLEKAGLTTAQAVHDVAQTLGVRRHDIGYAGLKDARAVTRQWMSVEHVSADQIDTLEIPRLRVLRTTHHKNKLRLGHLKGNHFVIKVRETNADRLAELQDGLAELMRHGVPNYFGVQRFGYRGDTWRVGQSIVAGKIDEAVDRILGQPTPEDHGAVRRARERYDAGDYTGAARAWPRPFQNERRAVKALARAGGNARRAFSAIDKGARTFYVSAYQSYLFNQVVAKRLETGLGTLQTGDLAWLHASGAVFRVADAEAEQARADELEISASGPLFGYRMTEPDGVPGELEAGLLAEEGLSPSTFRTGKLRVKGGRRPLRFLPTDAALSLGADARGPYLELRFALPRGCYATVLLRELFAAASPTRPTDDGDAEASA